MNRSLKQLLYGLFYLLIIGVVIYFTANYFISKYSCQENCEEIIPTPLTFTEDLELFYLDTGVFSSFVEINNPNPNLDAEIFYSFNLYNKNGDVMKVITGDSFISGSSDSKYLVLNDTLTEEPKRVTFKVEDMSWVSEGSYPSLDLSISNLSINFSNNRNRVLISGTVINQDDLNDADADVLIFLKDNLGNNIFVVTSRVSNVTSRSEKDFSINLVIPSSLISQLDLNNFEVFINPLL